METTVHDLTKAIDRFLEAAARVTKDRALRPLELRMERQLARAFRAEGRAFLERFVRLAGKLPGALTDADWVRLLEAAQMEMRDTFIAAFRSGAREAMTVGIAHAAAATGLPAGTDGIMEADPRRAEAQAIAVLLGIRFDLDNPRAVEYLLSVGADLVTAIDETTRDYIRTVIVRGVSEGQSYGEMARAITDRYAEFAVGKPQLHIDSRAHLIAVTETGQAYSHGNYIVGEELRDAGLKMEKHWDTMGDSRVSAGCAENEGAGWIPFDSAFPSGHLRPLRFPGCRCDLLMRRVGAEE